MKKHKKDIANYSTRDLVEELKQREGVRTHHAEPDSKVAINETGPVTVLVVTD